MNRLLKTTLLTICTFFILLFQPNVNAVIRINDPAIRNDTIRDCKYTLAQALKGCNAPKDILNTLRLVSVAYYSFDGKLHSGQLLIHKDLEKDIKRIFKKILDNKFPVAKVIPISKYNWIDSLSMRDNNTSAFNYRKIKGTKILSKHSYGKAIDINPLINPKIKNGMTEPYNARYTPEKQGVFSKNNTIKNEFAKLGWQWGGNWKRSKDYQHFEK
ncbi:MAG: M15 family metallopeptidase [Bacteroidota bacterium]|nr:M15 family metallopeptidase [Bacteroidota bacterium]